MNINDLKAVVKKAAELDNINKYEWLDDCIEDAEKETGIMLEDEYRGRAIQAVHLIETGYDRIDEFIENGFTLKIY